MHMVVLLWTGVNGLACFSPERSFNARDTGSFTVDRCEPSGLLQPGKKFQCAGYG